MRIQAFLLIVLTTGWVLPAGAFACAPHTETDAHSQTPHQDGHDHSHAASDRGAAAPDHVAGSDAPICCDDEGRTPTVVASVVDSKPRPKSIPLALRNPLLDVPQPVVLPSRARLRLRQPPPLPYARTRRPLLI